MRIDNTTIYAVYGEYSALYRDKKDVPSEMEKQSFRIISGNPRQFNYRDESANCAYLHS